MINTDKPTIRAFELSDLDELLTIFRLNVPHYFDPKEEQDLIRFIKYDQQHFLVMEVADKVVGCCGYMIHDTLQEGKITWMFLHPAHQGKALGRQLVTYCLQRIDAHKNLKRVIVRTSQLAHGFFKKFGFALLNVDKDYWGNGLDLYYMVRD